MKLKILGAVAFSVPSIVIVLAFYAMSQMTIQHLISCSSNDGGTMIPHQVCNLYMKNFRVTPSDVEDLSNSAGLEYILNSENKEKYQIAELFIKHGLNIDSINHFSEDKVTPLYASVLYNDLKMTSFLLKHGANPTLINEKSGLSPYQLAMKLSDGSNVPGRKLLLTEFEKYITKP